MKMKVDHLVPLCTQAVAILRSIQPMTGHGRFAFPSRLSGERAMSEMDEVMGQRVDLIERQLAHAVKDPNGRAYNRTAHLPARRAMMQAWADYLDKLRIGADVIQFKTA
jgi:integrase